MHRCLHSLLLFVLAFAGLQAQTPVNSPGLDTPREVDPLLRPDGKELLFTRTDYVKNKGADNAADIWMMTRYADGSWGRALNPGSPINSFAHDRALAYSPDGSRLAVLRTGTVSYVELLESSGRNWRILDTWPLPEGVAPRFDLTFDPNAQQLIYSAYDGGNLDLYRRQALPGGSWGKAVPLYAANGPDNEMSPTLAADGRTLYFRRNGSQWFRQDDPDTRPVSIAIPGSVLQFSVSLLQEEVIATLPGSGGSKDYLAVLPVAPADLPPPVSLVRGYLSGPPAPGEQTSSVSLRNGTTLTIRPDALNRYSVFLRDGEALASTLPLQALAPGKQAKGSLATTGNTGSSLATDRQQLEAGIARRQRELDRLDAERKKYDLVAPKTEDPELVALREKFNRSTNSSFSQDTLPPATVTSKGGSARPNRYAKELDELERMKAKFRQQQNERLGDRSRTKHQWSQPTTPPATTSSPAHHIPSIGEAYRPLTLPPRTPEEQARAYNDSLRLAAEIRNGLRRDNSPRVYERAAWENEVRQGLPRQTPLSPAEIAALDADYQRQLDELEVLRAELRRLEETTGPTIYRNTPAPAAGREWSAKGSPSPTSTTNQPAAVYQQPYRRPAEPTLYGTPPAREMVSGSDESLPPKTTRGRGAPMPAGISFIPNTAYPDGRGYTGLEQLIGLIRQSTSVLEIRIHTPTNLPPRAAQLLSEERAVTIRNYLLDKGVSETTFQVIGYGNNLTGEQGERVEVLR